MIFLVPGLYRMSLISFDEKVFGLVLRKSLGLVARVLGLDNVVLEKVSLAALLIDNN